MIGAESNGTHIAEQGERNHSVRSDGHVPAHLHLAPEQNAKHVLGADAIVGRRGGGGRLCRRRRRRSGWRRGWLCGIGAGGFVVLGVTAPVLGAG